MTSGAMDKEAEGRHSSSTLPVDGVVLIAEELLSYEITKKKPNQRGHRFGRDRKLVKIGVVPIPDQGEDVPGAGAPSSRISSSVVTEAL